MPIEKVLFYVFSALILGSATLVVTSRHTVRAVLFLVLAFVGSAGLWLLLEAEYLALTLIVVYVGAVMVLFLFVVMMLDMNTAPLKEGYIRYLPLATLVAILLIAQLMWVFGDWSTLLPTAENLVRRGPEYSSIHVLGQQMYTAYLYPVEIAAVLLLVAMISAVALTFRGPKTRKTQNISQQVQVRAADRIKLIRDLE